MTYYLHLSLQEMLCESVRDWIEQQVTAQAPKRTYDIFSTIDFSVHFCDGRIHVHCGCNRLCKW